MLLAVSVVLVHLVAAGWMEIGVRNADAYTVRFHHITVVTTFLILVATMMMLWKLTIFKMEPYIRLLSGRAPRALLIAATATASCELVAYAGLPVDSAHKDCVATVGCSFVLLFGSPHRGLALTNLLAFFEVVFLSFALIAIVVILALKSNQAAVHKETRHGK